MRLESIIENGNHKIELYELPRTHMEGLNFNAQECMSPSEWIRQVGENIFVEILEVQLGIRGRFREVSAEGTKSEFVRYYVDYVMQSEKLRQKHPEVYEFLREYIFGGREYSINADEELPV